VAQADHSANPGVRLRTSCDSQNHRRWRDPGLGTKESIHGCNLPTRAADDTRYTACSKRKYPIATQYDRHVTVPHQATPFLQAAHHQASACGFLRFDASQLRNDIAGQNFHVLHLVENWIQQKMSGARADKFSQLVEAFVMIAPDGYLRSHVSILVAHAKPVA
jgi:hypothetical protein